ncbi:MAG: sensor histidine kinase [Candidatus Dormibacteria bacterium]
MSGTHPASGGAPAPSSVMAGGRGLADPAHEADPGSRWRRSLFALVGAIAPPLHDWRFWAIQALIVPLAIAHLLIDVNGLLRTTPFPASTTVGFLLIPVGYAAVSFGIRGSVATALWATVLWFPDLLLPDGQGQPWADIIQLSLVIGMAVFVGWHIEGERAARRRAEIAEAAHLEAARRARSFATGVLQAQEEERKRIAQELHDSPVQLVAHLAQRLSADEGTGKTGQDGAATVPTVRELALSVLGELRNIARGLRPPVLDELGFLAALRGLVAQARRDSEAEVRLEAPPDWPAVPTGVEIALFRIAQESIRNAVRHGEPSMILVQLVIEDHQAVLTVTDDGCGFVPRSLDVHGNAGLGVMGMRERAELLGGDVVIASAPGSGTRVEVRVPVPSEVPVAVATVGGVPVSRS